MESARGAERAVLERAADALGDHVDLIASRWLERVRRAIYAGHGELNREDILDNTPQILRSVAQALRRHEVESLEAPCTTGAREHALKRLAQGLLLGDLVREYQVLRQETWRALHTCLAGLSTPEVYEVAEGLDAALDTMVTIATSAYGDELQRASERWRATLDAMADPVVIGDAQGRATYVNPSFADFLGRAIEPGIPVGEQARVYGLYHPDGTLFDPHDLPLQRAALRGEQVRDEEVLVRPAAGEERLFLFSASPLQDQEGRITGAVAVGRDITARRRAEEALRESEARYHTLFNSIDEGFFLIDVIFDEHDRPVDLFYVEANAAATRMLGRDYTGRRLREIDPNYEPYWFEIFGRVASTGESVRMERYAAPDRKWYSFYVFRVGGPQNRRIGDLFRDITPRKQAEAERERLLREADAARERFAAVVENAPVGICAWRGFDLVYELANPTYHAFAPGKRFLGRTYAEVWPEAREPFMTIIRRVMETGEPYYAADQPVRIRRRPDGPLEDAFFNIFYTALPPDASGQPGVLNIAVETTGQVRARKQIEELATEAQHRAAELDATIGSISDGLIIYGPQAEIRRMNATAERILDVSASEFRSASMEERAHVLAGTTVAGRPLSAHDLPGIRALRGEVVVAFHWVRHRPDGTTREVLSSAAPIRNEGGRILGAVVTLTDVTPLVEVQRQREDILRTVSHDLRQPLQGVLGAAQLLERRLGRAGLERELKDAHTIIASAQRLNTMIQDLVDAARSESGQLRLSPTPIDLPAFVERFKTGRLEMRDMLRVRVEPPPEPLPRVLADPARLERILGNLLSNALKYSDPSTLVTVTFARQDDKVVTSVTDRGMGISRAEQERLFQRYFRAEAASARATISVALPAP